MTQLDHKLVTNSFLKNSNQYISALYNIFDLPGDNKQDIYTEKWKII